MIPYLSEIRMMSFAFAPTGWALCNGQTLPVAQNQALFSLLGTTYGGDGRSNFMLPNLNGRVPLHFGAAQGQVYQLGAPGGEAAHTLSIAETAPHTHTLRAKAAAADKDAAGKTPGPTVVLAQAEAAEQGTTTSVAIYGLSGSNLAFGPTAIGNNAGGAAHPNQQPYLVLNFCIALTGIYPSRG